jgi:hypothetical protein
MQSAAKQAYGETSGWLSSIMAWFATVGLIWDLATALDED